LKNKKQNKNPTKITKNKNKNTKQKTKVNIWEQISQRTETGKSTLRQMTNA
jgi:hypothetical protein